MSPYSLLRQGGSVTILTTETAWQCHHAGAGVSAVACAGDCEKFLHVWRQLRDAHTAQGEPHARLQQKDTNTSQTLSSQCQPPCRVTTETVSTVAANDP